MDSNCTKLQWWNGTYCRNKGTPAWGTKSADICNATYQCADYNLVSCPLGGSSLVQNATCECATTKYWVISLSIFHENSEFIVTLTYFSERFHMSRSSFCWSALYIMA